MDTDFFLIRRMKDGDDSAIEEFVRKYYPRILHYCYLHVRDSGYAEDMTQEAFARFFRTFSQYHHYGKALNYLYTIAGNCCRDHLAKPQSLPLEDWADIPVPVIPALDARLDVHRALNGLPQELREAAVLYYFQEVPQKDIAQILGIGLPLVKYRLRRAKDLLRRQLDEEERI